MDSNQSGTVGEIILGVFQGINVHFLAIWGGGGDSPKGKIVLFFTVFHRGELTLQLT